MGASGKHQVMAESKFECEIVTTFVRTFLSKTLGLTVIVATVTTCYDLPGVHPQKADGCDLTAMCCDLCSNFDLKNHSVLPTL
jgi:hypothetical protein